MFQSEYKECYFFHVDLSTGVSILDYSNDLRVTEDDFIDMDHLNDEGEKTDKIFEDVFEYVIW